MTKKQLDKLSEEEKIELRKLYYKDPGNIIFPTGYPKYQEFLDALFEDPREFFSID